MEQSKMDRFVVNYDAIMDFVAHLPVRRVFLGESEFNMPQAYGHACPPAIYSCSEEADSDG